MESLWKILMPGSRPVGDPTLPTIDGGSTPTFSVRQVEDPNKFLEEINQHLTKQIVGHSNSTQIQPQVTAKQQSDWMKFIDEKQKVLKWQNDYFNGVATKRAIQDATDYDEFHIFISSLADYPALMRGFNLILDCSIPRSIVTGAPAFGNMSLIIANTDPTPSESVTFSTFEVAYLYDETEGNFTTRAIPGSPFVKGYVQLRGNAGKSLAGTSYGFQVNQLDAIPTAYSIERKIKDSLATKAASAAFVLPTQQSRGLSIDMQNRNQVNAKVTSRALHASAATQMLDDLVLGFIVDVHYQNNWYSLHERSVSYGALNSTQTGSHITVDDEGFLSENPSIIKPPTSAPEYMLPDSLFRWDNWSLSAPRLEKSSDESESGPRNTQMPMLLASATVRKHSLPKLRFGEKYKFRIRVVDLCGNCVSKDTIIADTQLISEEVVYFRQEPVSSPDILSIYRLVPRKGDNVYNEIWKSINGESKRVMCVRSGEGSSGTNYSDYSARYVAAPRISQKLAEAHGKFDEPGKQGLIKDKSLVRRAFYQAPEEASYPVYDPENDYLPKEEYISYLPDPMSYGFTIGLKGKVNGLDGVAIRRETQALFNAGLWPEYLKWPIILKRGNVNKFVAKKNPVPHIVFTLQKAEQVELELITLVNEDSAVQFGVDFRIATDPERRAVKKSIIESTNKLLTPPGEIKLVHAVQKPLFAPIISQNTLVARQPGQTNVAMSQVINYPGKSADKLELFATWEEWDDSPSKPFYHRETIARKLVCDLKCDQEIDGNVALTALHEFSDTKHRIIYYEAAARSRFTSYFPALDGNRPRDFTIFSKPYEEKSILATEKPEALNIVRVIPIHLKKKKAAGIHSSTSGFRIYLERGKMFDRGEGMKIIFPIVNDSVPPEQLDFFSCAGRDLILTTGKMRTLHSKDFMNAFKKVSGIRLQEVTTANDIEGAIYEPKPDKLSNLWYVDVLLSGEIMNNLPFVRFSLAKYQEKAIYYKEMSDTVQTLFLPLGSEKSLTLTNRGTKYSFSLTDNAFINGTPYSKEVVIMFEKNDAEVVDENSMDWEATAVKVGGIQKESVKLTESGGTWTVQDVMINSLPNYQAFRIVILEYHVYPQGVGNIPEPIDHFKEEPITLQAVHKHIVDMYIVLLKEPARLRVSKRKKIKQTSK